MSSNVKSFRKVGKPVSDPVILGTQASPHNFSLLTSSGLAALDTLLGGGMPIGSLVVIEEDEFGQYAEVLSKYFISEGIHSSHCNIVASNESDLKELLQSLPGEINEQKKPSSSAGASEDMTIAWRYNNLNIADSTIARSGRLGHRLRLNVEVKAEVRANADVIEWKGKQGSSNLMEDLTKVLQKTEHTIATPNKKVLRVCVMGLGSPSWPMEDVSRTLYLLRSWLRRSVAVGLVTIPAHLHKDSGLVFDWRHLADIVIGLESFAGTDRALNPALKEYQGFLQVVKLPAFNSIAPHIPPSDLAFKLRRRHFTIERMSLPPELEDTTARGGGLSCGSASSTGPLDF